MNRFVSLGLDGLLTTLLTCMAEECQAESGLLIAAGGAVLAHYPPSVPPLAPPSRIMDRLSESGVWIDGITLYAPLTIGARAVAGLILHRTNGNPFDENEARRLLAHAERCGLAWSPLPTELPPEEESLPPLHVLVAEDNDVNRKVAKAFLEHAGHAVVTCGDGAAAVEAVCAGDFDVVLMDIRMPGVDGIEATQKIRALPDRRRAALPILALTANFTSSEVEAYMAAGMNDVIRKPLRLGDIEKALAPYFGLPDLDSPPLPLPTKQITPAEPQVDPAQSSPIILDPQRAALLADALPAARLQELYISACASIRETIDELRIQWSLQNHPAIAKSAHRLAGVAANFGCSALCDVARSIEAEAKQSRLMLNGMDLVDQLASLTLEALTRLT